MQYLEFTTHPKNPYTHFSLGSPVHDGKMPTKYEEVEGVRIDGESVQFKDETLVNRLQKTLLNRKPYVRNYNFECTDFAGLMMEHPEMDARGMIPYSTDRYGEPVSPDDDSIDQPLNLYIRKTELSNGSWNHMIVPAHTIEGPMYIHKLGSGPICLSGLTKALEIYSCDSAYVAKIQLSSPIES